MHGAEKNIPQSPIVKSGYLYKKGAERRNWKKRWFELRSHSLAYYKSPACTKLKGEIPLSGTHIEEFKYDHRDYVMAIKSCNRVYYVSATSSDDMRSWIKSITNCISGVATTSAPAEKARILNGHTFDNGSMASNPASGLKRFMYQPKSISFDSGSVPNDFYIPPTFLSTRSFSRDDKKPKSIPCLPDNYTSLSSSELIELAESLARQIKSVSDATIAFKQKAIPVVTQLADQLNVVSKENQKLTEEIVSKEELVFKSKRCSSFKTTRRQTIQKLMDEETKVLA